LKKVLLFESYPFFSGAQRVSLNLCKVLYGEGYHITLLLADDPDGIHKEKFGQFVSEIINIPTSNLLTRYGNADQWFKLSGIFNTLIKGLIPFYKQCFKIFKKNQYDYIYFCDPRGAVMMSLPSMFFKAKKICYLQGKNKLSKLMAKLVYLSFTDVVLCPSKDVLDSLPYSSKKMVLNYGVDFSQYSHIDPTNVINEVNSLLQGNGKTKLLYAGLIRPQKGVHHLIRAMKYLKANLNDNQMPVLFLLGEPKNESEVKFKDYLVKYVDDNDIGQYIQWIGWKDNVLEWMSSFDYFIFPTIDKEECNFEGFDRVIESSEGSPVVLIESSLCGLYTIASKVTGVNETITNGHNGVTYDPKDEKALPETLLKVLNEKPVFIDFPNRQMFSTQLFASKVLSVFS
jgi:glycosyltransferase involved in cell wall biosynthesis